MLLRFMNLQTLNLSFTTEYLSLKDLWDSSRDTVNVPLVGSDTLYFVSLASGAKEREQRREEDTEKVSWNGTAGQYQPTHGTSRKKGHRGSGFTT